MFIEEIILILLRVAVFLVVGYVGWAFLKPIVRYFWEPHKIVLEAERNKRIAQAKLEATRIEIEASKAWDQCGKAVDNLLEEQEEGRYDNQPQTHNPHKRVKS